MNFFKIGNKKIGSDTLVGNVTSATDCPSKKLGFCRLSNNFRDKRKTVKVCYACRMEYSNKVLLHRRKQVLLWKYEFESIIKEVEYLYSRNRHMVFIRLNESGDFLGADCIEKVKRLSEKFPQLITYFYTKRYDLIDGLRELNKLKNVVVTISELEIDGFNCFKIVDEIKPEYKYVCKADCYHCNLCKEKTPKKIYVRYH